MKAVIQQADDLSQPHVNPELLKEYEALRSNGTTTAGKVPPHHFLSHNLPELEEDEFLIDLTADSGDLLVCVREIGWEEAVRIEGASFQQGQNGVFYSGEAEIREVLRRAIQWVAEGSTNKIVLNRDGQILSKIKDVTVREVWDRYQQVVYLSADDAYSIYNTGKAFFSGEDLGMRRMHPVILEVDAMRKGILTLNRSEFRSLSVKEFEQLQVAWRAYSEALPRPAMESDFQDVPTADLEFFDNFSGNHFPPHLRSR
jgi:hypothetical protein